MNPVRVVVRRTGRSWTWWCPSCMHAAHVHTMPAIRAHRAAIAGADQHAGECHALGAARLREKLA